jgi:hypothetical protein
LGPEAPAVAAAKKQGFALKMATQVQQSKTKQSKVAEHLLPKHLHMAVTEVALGSCPTRSESVHVLLDSTAAGGTAAQSRDEAY